MVPASRAEFDESVAEEELESLVSQPDSKVLRCVEPVREGAWRRIDDSFCPRRPGVALWVYRHYASDCELRFARPIPNARRFAADRLTQTNGVEALAELRNLESLCLGISELEDLDERLAGICELFTNLTDCAPHSTVRHMVDADAFDKLELELRRGVVVLATLSQLRKPRYGYELRQTLADKGFAIEEGTLYPLLRRLEAQGLLASEWKIEDGPPRRYYALNADGRKLLKKLTESWQDMNAAMDRLLKDERP